MHFCVAKRFLPFLSQKRALCAPLAGNAPRMSNVRIWTLIPKQMEAGWGGGDFFFFFFLIVSLMSLFIFY